MRGAIFDMDGLLIDSERLWQEQWHLLAAERGVTLPESFAGEMCGSSGAATRALVARYYRTDEPETVMRECTLRVHRMEEKPVPLMKGAREILDGLRDAGFRLAVASSSPMDMIERNLGLDGLLDCFDVLTSGREVEHGKPAPDIFLLAAKRLGLPPEECYVFEDSLNGVKAGWRAGCRSIMIPDLISPSAEAREHCFAIYRDLSEAWEHIKP